MENKIVKNKGGRPPLPEGKKRSRYVSVPITQDEWNYAHELAYKSGKNLTQFFRDKIFNAST